MRKLRETALRWEKVVEFGVEAEVRNGHDTGQSPMGHPGQYRVYTERRPALRRLVAR